MNSKTTKAKSIRNLLTGKMREKN